jgi:hypothetical protein
MANVNISLEFWFNRDARLALPIVWHLPYYVIDVHTLFHQQPEQLDPYIEDFDLIIDID